MSWTVTRIERQGYNLLITLIERTIFSRKAQTFIGNCTVWYLLPDYKRASTSMETLLSDIQTEFEHELQKRIFDVTQQRKM